MQLPSKFGDDPSPDGRGRVWEALPQPVPGTLFLFRSTPWDRPGTALCSPISRPIALIFSGHTVPVGRRLEKSSAGPGEAGWRRWAPTKVSDKLVLHRARAQVGRPGGVGWPAQGDKTRRASSRGRVQASRPAIATPMEHDTGLHEGGQDPRERGPDLDFGQVPETRPRYFCRPVRSPWFLVRFFLAIGFGAPVRAPPGSL